MEKIMDVMEAIFHLPLILLRIEKEYQHHKSFHIHHLIYSLMIFVQIMIFIL